MGNRVTIFICLLISGLAFSDGVAVFPVQGVNTDKSFADAFGALLANKYGKISGQRVIPPVKSARAIGADSNLTEAAKSLGVGEYLEIDAVGLYLSRDERGDVRGDSSAAGQRIIIIREKGDDDDEDDDDQEKLDNSKTIVTVTRMSVNGNEIYRAEMTLVTYGDIEESTERFALALHKKLSVDQVRSMTNITRREGMGHNRLFVESIKGVKFGGYYVTAADVSSFSPLVSIGFDYKAESEKFFLEFGAGALFPSGFLESTSRKYSGNYFEVGGSYYVLNGVVGLYAGGGVTPFLNWLEGMQMGLAPYIQVGFMFPRNSRTRFYADLRVAQNVMPITTGEETDTFYDPLNSAGPVLHKDYPTLIGFEIGIGW